MGEIKNLIFDDRAGREAFLMESEKRLRSGHLQSAIELAQKRNTLIPGDVDAGIVMIQGLIGLGLRNEAIKLMGEIKSNLQRWSSMVDMLDRPNQHAPVLDKTEGLLDLKQNNDVSPEQDMQHDELAESNDAVESENNVQADQSDSIILKDFYTPTMAELFMHQGHIDMARDIYSALVAENPEDAVLKKRLNDLEAMITGALPKEDFEKQWEVIDELERWVTKIRKSH